MHAGERKKKEVMASFPSTLSSPVLADHAALSKLYKSARSTVNLSDDDHLICQMVMLERHVKTCIELWELIRGKRLVRSSNIDDLYLSRSDGRPISISPRKQHNTPTSNRAKAADFVSDLAMLSQFRRLAELWHGQLTVREVPLLCHFGDEVSLRKMKVSCASDLVKNKMRQLFP